MLATTATIIALMCLATASASEQVIPGSLLTPIPPNFALGDCVTGRMTFTKDTVTDIAGAEARRFSVDRTKYNFTLDYGTADFGEGSMASLALVRNSQDNPMAVAFSSRISTTRYMQYGRITIRFKPAAIPGVVTTFITFSDIQKMAPLAGELTQDEIDWEIVGKDTAHPQTNLFTYKALDLERGMHGGPISAAISTDTPHDYTIDWKSDRIVWSIDNIVMRTLMKSDSRAMNPAALPLNESWFPVSPSRVQISVWDGSLTHRSWAGGPINWPPGDVVKVPFEWMDIQCYDNSDRPVERWSADGSKRATSEAPIVVPGLSGSRRMGQTENNGNHTSASVGGNWIISHSTTLLMGCLVVLLQLGL
ncbi:hypothetical protein BASA50_005236 [Batrachochytrium salamandrivorans]|uniref:GH16 domain-containing protein n=1 Tax=Batrachochytrium salamandrivorans TaxID=1357716 RepID=A0ABQ8FD40_9FUNG|nr:hypothetical protein BASA62_004430 [Batrachochytrium salamandrivorans]KAH6596196.1 hypothetical protein BASA50_005236 [Batrachochytrium salamandrivorans]KAH9272060.1 hypothetical protein BASA83_005647 [Batrachochytrium salamandrivorans]